jgi:hypothetical protein
VVDAPKSAEIDGFGRRTAGKDRENGEDVELLDLAPSLVEHNGFVTALAERVARLSSVRHASYTHLRRLDRPDANRLEMVSGYVAGWRLSELLDQSNKDNIAVDITIVISLLRQLLPAVALFGRHNRESAIGTLAVERLIVTPQSRLVIAEHAFGPAMEKLNMGREKLWRELRVAMPPSAGLPRANQRSDAYGLGVIALSLLLGRPLTVDEFPEKLQSLVEGALEYRDGKSSPLSTSFSNWLQRALQFEARTAFQAPSEAQLAFESVLASDRSYVTATKHLDQWVQHVGGTLGELRAPKPDPAVAQQQAQDLERRQEEERQREIERQQEEERDRQQEAEIARLRDLERQRAEELETLRQQEKQRAEEVERLRQQEKAREQEREKERQREKQQLDQEREREKQQREKEREAERKQLEQERQQAREQEQKREQERQQQLQREREKAQQEIEKERERAREAERQREQERQRAAEAAAAAAQAAAAIAREQGAAEARAEQAAAPQPNWAPSPVEEDPIAAQIASYKPAAVQQPVEEPVAAREPEPEPEPVPETPAAYAEQPTDAEQPTYAAQESYTPPPPAPTPAPAKTYDDDDEKPANRMPLIAAGVVVLLLLAVVGWLLTRSSGGGGGLAAGEGELAVQSKPQGARVIVDGKEVGTTPTTVRLPAGPHVLEVQIGKLEPRVIPLTISAGVQTSQFIELQDAKLTGSLSIRSEPAGARITIDGLPRGTTPATVPNLSAGEHTVVLELGGRKATQAVKIEPGSTAQLVVPMPRR